MYNGVATVENSVEGAPKTKNRPRNYIRVYTQQKKAGSQRDNWTLAFAAEFFTIAKRWKHPECPSPEEWRNIMVLTDEGICFSFKEEG